MINQNSPSLYSPPTRSLGINRSSLPCLRNTVPLVWLGLMPTPSVAVGRAGCVGGQLRCEGTAGKFRFDEGTRNAKGESTRTVGDDGARRRGNLELLRRVLEHRGERGLLGDAQPVWEGGGDGGVSDAASDRLPRGPERRGAVGRTGAVVNAGRRETTRRTYTRNGNLGSDVSVILKETFDIITGCGRSCATRANLEVPSGSARGPLRTKSAEHFMGRFLLFLQAAKIPDRDFLAWVYLLVAPVAPIRSGQLALTRLVFTGYP